MPRDGDDGTTMEPAPAARIPLATYRLRFNRRFTFDDAARLVPYPDALGITDLYASTYLAARPGSLHGYDIVDHQRLNHEIGSTGAYDRMVAALRARGMGQILDVVPNHMGIAEGAVCAFARHAATRTVIVVVPRLTARLTGNGACLPLGPSVWADTHVLLPERLAAGRYLDAFTGAETRSTPGEAGPALAVGDLLARFPVALLERGE